MARYLHPAASYLLHVCRLFQVASTFQATCTYCPSLAQWGWLKCCIESLQDAVVRTANGSRPSMPWWSGRLVAYDPLSNPSTAKQQPAELYHVFAGSIAMHTYFTW